jgi:hypothetical protein
MPNAPSREAAPGDEREAQWLSVVQCQLTQTEIDALSGDHRCESIGCQVNIASDIPGEGTVGGFNGGHERQVNDRLKVKGHDRLQHGFVSA